MGGIKVLYLDDELDLLDLAVGFFEDENLQLDTCADVETAINLVRCNDYAVVLSDANMPSGSGHDFFQRLREELHYEGKLILVTGNLQAPGTREDAHYDVLIYKPIKFLDLVERVKLLLGP